MSIVKELFNIHFHLLVSLYASIVHAMTQNETEKKQRDTVIVSFLIQSHPRAINLIIVQQVRFSEFKIQRN